MNPRIILALRRPGHAATALSAQQHANFRHLYLDIAWFGVLSGSSVSFITIYLARIGATGLQIGLLSAIPAVAALFLALPAGWWLKRQPLDRAVYRSSVYFRLFYALWIPLPILIAPSTQTWWLLAFTLLMSVPGTILAVGFNALYAEVVPPEWRGQVAGVRNSMLALTTVGSSLLSGVLLSRLAFPVNYQIVFVIGLLGAAMSSYHLRQLRLQPTIEPRVSSGRSLGDYAQPGLVRPAADSVRTTTGLRFLTRMRDSRPPKPAVLQGTFGRVWFAFLIFHLALYLSIPLYPIYWVDEIGLPDSVLSLGNAVFYTSVLLGSTQIARILRRLGNRRVTVLGAVAMVLYPGLTSMTHTAGMYLVVNIVSGLASSLINAAMPNHILDRIPADDRPAYLAWINLATSAAILTGSVVGPLVAGHLGLSTALALFATARLFAAIVVWRWG